MTVAIRAFRMEMEQASHVTDVYSKVAAVTASDTEELITAMSKTASSAEAVGSSFENTTAMLAVMLESTRESATNIGSAMKSIISRYGEMKTGSTTDAEGEAIAYNKVDTALQSIGMTLKDTNGQFRDFDDVIEELASKWDTLSSVQQRYIATIFAGNRQQSRFLALVSNYDRYMEVSAAAANAEDAGLLQYSKTLDSLETKLNNLSTSFQQFYMSLANGGTFGGAIEGITKFIEGLNKLGNFSAIANIAGIISSLRLVGKTAVTTFTTTTSQIKSNVETVFTQIAASMVSKMRAAGRDSSLAVQQGAIEGQQQTKNGVPVVGFNMDTKKGVRWAKGINAAAFVGAGLSMAGTSVAADNAVAGSLMTGAGSILSYGSQGAMIGASLGHPVIGAIAGGIIGLFSQLPAFVSARANQAQEELDKATKKAEEKNLERAQAAEDYRSLESTIENLKKLQAARYDSEEAAKAFADAQKDAAEKFPELVSGYTATGDAIVDVINGTVDAEELLTQARKKSAAATLEAAQASLNEANKQITVDEQKLQKYSSVTAEFSGYNLPDVFSQKDIISFLQDYYYGYITADNKKTYGENLKKAAVRGVGGTQEYHDLSNYYLSEIQRYQQENNVQYDETVARSVSNILAGYALSRKYEKQYQGTVSSAENTQRLAQQTIFSASLSDYLIQKNDKSEWLNNTTAYKTISEAFTSKFFDATGNLLAEYENIFDEEGNANPVMMQEEIASFLTKYNLFLSTLTGDTLDDFEQIIKDTESGSYTARQLSAELSKFGDVPVEIISQFSKQLENTKERLQNKINSATFLSERGKESDTIQKLYTDVPPIIQNQIASYITDLEEQIKNNKITESAAQAFLVKYANFINSIYSSSLSYSQKNVAANIISQGDMTTLSGQYKIQQQLNEELGDLAPKLVFQDDNGKWVSVVGTAVENVVLSYQAFAEDLAASVKTLADVFKNVSSGFELEDAQKIADKVGESIESLFDFSEGKWFIKQDSFDAIYKAYDKTNDEMKALLEQQNAVALENIRAYYDTPEGEEASAEATLAYNTYLEGAKSYYEKQNPGRAFDSLSKDLQIQAFNDYLNFVGESAISAATTQLEWLKEEVKKDAKAATEANEIAKRAYGDRKDWIEAFNVLKNKGGNTGFTPEEVQKIVSQGILTEDQFTVDKFGNFNLTKENYRKALTAGSQALADQYDTQLADKAKQLAEQVRALGKNVKLGTASDTDWFSVAKDVLGTEEVSKTQKDILKNLFLSYSNDEAYFKNLVSIAQQFEIPAQDLYEYIKEFVDGTSFGVQDLQKQILDNYAKVLKGELTDVDIAALDGEVGAAVQKFADDTSNQISKYIEALLASTSMSFSEMVSSLSSVYKDQLEKQKPSFSSPKLLANNTRMSSSQAGQMLAELNLLFGEEKYTAGELFAYNIADQTYSLIGKQYEQIYQDFQQKINDRTTDPQKKAQLKNFLPLLQSAASEAFFASAQSASETVKKFATSTEMTFKDIQSIYSELGENITAADASAKAAELNKLADPWDRIKGLIKIYSDFDVTLDAGKYNEIVNTVFDSILSAISNALSKLSSGLSGKLSFSDFQSLIDQGYVEASQGRIGYNGITLTNKGRQQYLTKLYQEAKQLGNTQGLGDEIWSTLSDSQNQIFDGYVEIEEEIKRIQEKLSGLSKEPDKTNLQDYLALLNQVRAAAMFDPNAAEFDFMGQESTDGLTKNFDKFLSSIDTVKSAFSTLQSGGSIGYDQFYNMADFLEKFANNGELASALDKKRKTISDFANAVVLSSKEIGKADLGTIAAQLGVSMSEAAQMMGGDMEQGLKAVAEQQVKYLTGLEGMLKALAAMDGLNAKAGIAFTYTKNGEPAEVEPGEILNTWNSLQGFPDETKKEFKVAFEETYAVEFNEANATVLDKFFKESSGKMSMMTQDQVTSWTQYVYSLMDPTTSPLYKDGKLIDDWGTVLDSVFSSALDAIDTSAYEEMLKNKIKDAFGDAETVALDDNVEIKYDIGNAKITVTNDGGLNKEELKKKLDEKLAAQGLYVDYGENELEFNIKSTVKSGATQELVSEKAAAEAKSLLDDIKGQIEAIGDMKVTPTVSITVKGLLGLVTAVSLLKSLGGKSGVNVGAGSGDTTGGTGSFTGTIGKAFADGSLGRLRYGAARAQETLVGELGPELAVYDGQYHLLGKNGAEFVKLPDDAIIFNHLQTQGIMRGQMNIRGTMMASGTMSSGPAMASGNSNISAALAAVQRAKSVWQGLLNKLTAQDLLGSGGGGGGGGGDKTAVIQDLQEWYNLSRQIANIEQEINNIVAERENIADGGAYLRSLRQQQELLQDQVGIQKVLLDYQDKQLQRQADLINNDRIWSKFLTVGEGGLLQYTVGNETNGGKGALQVLDELNKMSAEQQINYLKSIGYTYTDNDGKELKDTELVTKFFEELQKQIDEYDALYDTVHATKQTVEKLKSDIEKINEEVIQNQKDLEKVIYDVIVDAWQKQIDALDEQAKLAKEVNDNYVDGLNDALKLEQERYQQNQQIADRESMQRQLALLRRSGGSASEIASLEKQLDEKLKDEYFDNQQKAIDKIQEANEKQVQQLELQVQLQKEALDYQKENGIIWTKVYDVMANQKDEILKFIQGNATDFFSKSTLEQEAMLTDWAKKIGIYTEDRQYQNYSKDAQNKYWATGAVWGNKNLASLKSVFDSLSDADRKEIQNAYISTYADAMLRGADETVANEQAAKEMAAQLSNKQKATEQKPNVPTVETPAPAQETKKETQDYTHWMFTFNGKKYAHYTSKANAENKIKALMEAGMKQADKDLEEGKITMNAHAQKYGFWQNMANQAKKSIRSGKHSKGYIEGGLVDYTGPAIVHGTPARPEAFLNAEQTKQIREGLELGSDRGILSNLRSTISELNHAINSIVNNNVSTNEINISNGAIQISVGKLNDKYDIEDVSNDIMNRIVSIASKASNRGVNRR